jgi:CDP-diacylglycerol--glycerol-3-phosphate 3-phosphatidyltransferase
MTWNIPNCLSVARIALGPLCIYLLTREAYLAVLVLMIAGEISDFLDGHLARSLGQVTNAGKIIDPMSDSLYRQIIFIGFHAIGLLPTWMLIVLFSRDIIVSYLRIMAEQAGVTLSARQSGKIKALAQGFAQIGVVCLLIGQANGFVETLGSLPYWFFLIATLVTFYSLIDYGQAVLKLTNQQKPESQ